MTSQLAAELEALAKAAKEARDNLHSLTSENDEDVRDANYLNNRAKIVLEAKLVHNLPAIVEALRMAKADYADEFGPCAVCGGACNPLAANPSLWPSLTGHRKYAHLECVQKAIEALRRMEKLETRVKAAFYEGYDSYTTSCVSYVDPDEAWEASEARAALSGDAQ